MRANPIGDSQSSLATEAVRHPRDSYCILTGHLFKSGKPFAGSVGDDVLMIFNFGDLV
jgi:hypothetical protein